MSQSLNILKKYWGYNSFRPKQLEVINSILKNDDCLVLFPTAGGKSICFQIPAIIKKGVCIVVSPLISLIQDQVKNLNDKGIKAIALTNINSKSELNRLLDNCQYGNYKFIYISPERLKNKIVRERIKTMDINLIAIDEAHCISQWGHDFRPAYHEIKYLRELCPKSSLVALTATATSEVMKDICEKLNMINPKLFIDSFFRSNLSYNYILTNDVLSSCIFYLKKSIGPAIIYVRSRQSSIEIAKKLNYKGIASDFYHGGLDFETKKSVYINWKENKTRVIVATNAFGMGIDKADVEKIIHLSIPESLESYFQETGRAGRNGDKSNIYLIIDSDEIIKIKKWISNQIIEISFLKEVYRKLSNYFQISYGEISDATHGFIYKEFCKRYNLSERKTYNCLKVLERNGIIVFIESFKNKTLVQFHENPKMILDTLTGNKKNIVKNILRTNESVLHELTPINLDKISSNCGVKKTDILETLKKLELEKIATLKTKNTDGEIRFMIPREDELTINKISKSVEIQNKIKLSKLKSVINYINNTRVCRSQQLLSYFEEKTSKNCGICDVCKATK